MSRAQRFAFALASLAILVAIYHVSLQLPSLRSDTPSADWTVNPIPTQWSAHPVPTHTSYTPNEPHHTSDPPPSDPPPSDPPPSASSSKASPGKAIQTGSPSKALQSDSRFTSWLSARVPTEHVPFITIGDGKYVHALRNFRHRLDQWGYGDDFVVICLDQCCADARDYHAYPYFIGESVAFIKFSINLDLTSNGYNFVFLDGDVYLTGAADPFENMLPLSNDTWDVQFQPDHQDAMDYNIGWYFAKATENTFEYFNRSYTMWNETHAWDQEVMNEVGKVMEFEENSLRVHHLNLSVYKNFMLFGWEGFFGQDQATQDFVNESTIIHFTCIEQSLKTYFGYYFGGFGDMDHYYSDPPPLLGTANISGMIDAVHAQVAFAAQLAHKTRRTFIWPDTINLMRTGYDAEHNKTTLEHQERQPGIRTISWESALNLGLPAVEGNYLTNFRRVNHTELKTVYLDAHASVSALEEAISKLSPMQVAILDFANFSPPIYNATWEEWKREENSAEQGEHREHEGEGEGNETEEKETDPHAEKLRWLKEKEEEWFGDTFEAGGYKAFSEHFLDRLKKCRNANGGDICLNNCGG